jgi:hypothetical protein
MRIRKIPDLMPEEKIHGFQVLIKNYAIDVFICLNWQCFRFDCNYQRGDCFTLKLGIFNYECTNLDYDMWGKYGI